MWFSFYFIRISPNGLNNTTLNYAYLSFLIKIVLSCYLEKLRPCKIIFVANAIC